MSEKVSSAQAYQVYAEVPGVLRRLANERDTLLSKVASLQSELDEYRTTSRIEKIASSMEDKHIDMGVTFEEKVARIKEASAAGRSLDAIEEAVSMTAPQGGLGHLGGELDVGNGAVELESFILGGLD